MCYINSINTLMYGFNFFCPKSKDGYEKSYYGFIWFIVLLRTYLIIGKTTYFNSFKMPKVFCTLLLFLQTIFCLYFVYNFLSSLLQKELHHRNQSQNIDITAFEYSEYNQVQPSNFPNCVFDRGWVGFELHDCNIQHHYKNICYTNYRVRM